jgi:hypothetical protein
MEPHTEPELLPERFAFRQQRIIRIDDSDIRNEARGSSCKKQDGALELHIKTFLTANEDAGPIIEWNTDELVMKNVGKYILINLRFANHLLSKYIQDCKPGINTALQYMSCLKT